MKAVLNNTNSHRARCGKQGYSLVQKRTGKRAFNRCWTNWSFAAGRSIRKALRKRSKGPRPHTPTMVL